MREILYVISAIFMITTIILVKKTDTKISFIKNASLALVIKISYNVLVSYILNTCGIKITLLNMALISIAISTLIWILIIKKNGIQEQSFTIKNTVAVCIIVAITIALTILNFGPELDIKYLTTDSAEHFLSTYNFYKTEAFREDFMPGAYVTTGLWFRVISPLIGEVNLYKVFIISDIIMLLTLLLLFYSAIEDKIDSVLKFVVSMLIVLLFACGYPLNSMIYGYCYLQLSIVVFGAFLIVTQLIHDKDKYDKKVIYTILLLLNFELFFTYCVFVPVMYIVEFVYLCYIQEISIKNLKLKHFAWLLYIFGIPLIAGAIEIVLPHLISVQEPENKVFIQKEGYIYRNIWGNFILLLPLAGLRLKKVEKDTTLFFILFATLILTMIAALLVTYGIGLSSYYYYKFNYVLWLVLWGGVMHSVITSKGITNKLAIVYLIIYTILAMLTVQFKHVQITKEHIDGDEDITTAFDIYSINATVMLDVEKDFGTEEIDLIKYVYDNIKIENNNTITITTPRQQNWLRAYFNNIEFQDAKSQVLQSEIDLWNQGKVKYMIAIYDNPYWAKASKEIIPGKILFENNKGIIYENYISVEQSL